MIPKPRRHTDRSYLEFVKEQPCLICRSVSTDAHHVSTRGSGGSDLTAVPLCRVHHVEIHKIGVETFAKRYDLNWKKIQLRLKSKYDQTGGKK